MFSTQRNDMFEVADMPITWCEHCVLCPYTALHKDTQLLHVNDFLIKFLPLFMYLSREIFLNSSRLLPFLNNYFSSSLLLICIHVNKYAIEQGQRCVQDKSGRRVRTTIVHKVYMTTVPSSIAIARTTWRWLDHWIPNE
jgi:hypothetical protein